MSDALEFEFLGRVPIVDPHGFDPLKEFPEFYAHQTIQHLAKKRRWTMSDNNKKPVNIQDVFLRWSAERGAECNNPLTMATLDELTRMLPNAGNCAFYLDYTLDGLICLDVESYCPDELKEKFLTLPYLYAETSLSGEGYHIILRPSRKFIELNPEAMTKTVLKNAEDGYEIHLRHWVTFTRWSLPPATGNTALEDIVGDFVKDFKPTNRTVADIADEHPQNEDVDRLTQVAREQFTYAKTVHDFSDDYSSFEFGLLTKLARWYIKRCTYETSITGHVYDESEIAWSMADTAAYHLEWRPKHDEVRDGLPWLVWNARNAYATVQANIAEEQAQKERKAQKRAERKKTNAKKVN